jgi:predicted O-methyltransferase YrrM
MIIIEHSDIFSLAWELQISRHGIVANNPDLDIVDQWYDRGGRKRKEAEVLSMLAKSVRGEHCIELGTSVGFGTMQLASNIYPGIVWTINILPEQLSKDMQAITHVLPKGRIGEVYRAAGCENVSQIYEDTQKWDIPRALRDIAFVFVDACHDRDFVLKDSVRYWPLVRKGGFMIWHDFSPSLRYDPRTSWIDSVMSGVEDFLDVTRLQDSPIHHVKDTWIGIMRREE